ncbi:MAG: potassium channel family protein [Treponema sp.]|jgi:voltage-gated potassium channel|nr:potassium channel family protein [Treponema sp.]
MIRRKRVFEILERGMPGDTLSIVVDYGIILIIVLNIVAVIISSFNDLPVLLTRGLSIFEYLSIGIFTLEYGLRLWTAPYKYPSRRFPYLRYILSFMALIDLCAILPFYLPFIVGVDLRVLRILRLFRLLRILKLNRYNNAVELIAQVFKGEKEKILTTVFMTGVMLLLAASVMYYVENAAQPDKFPNIIATLWWAVATLTTVGYGDVYPITHIGKVLSGLIAILGIGLVALPAGIISSGFIKAISKEEQARQEAVPKTSSPGAKQVCPHCGKEIE